MKVAPPLGDSGPLRFLVDEHLGRLARHLRLAGFDADAPHLSDVDEAPTSSDAGDQRLLDQAKESHRVLLTRDRALVDRAKRAGVQVHFVQALGQDEQFREVLISFDALDAAASGAGFLTRCLDCNSIVHRMPRDSAMGRVPADILATQDEFFCCQRCERVYWKGSHYARMREWLDKVTRAKD